jgi:nitrate reductase beta subunit
LLAIERDHLIRTVLAQGGEKCVRLLPRLGEADPCVASNRVGCRIESLGCVIQSPARLGKKASSPQHGDLTFVTFDADTDAPASLCFELSNPPQ